MTLLHSLGTAILGVAAVLQRPPFLFESDYLLTRKAVQFFVEFADREGDERVVVQQVVAP